MSCITDISRVVCHGASLDTLNVKIHGQETAEPGTLRLVRPYSLLRDYSYPALALQIPPAAPCQLPSQQLAKTLSLQLKLYL